MSRRESGTQEKDISPIRKSHRLCEGGSGIFLKIKNVALPLLVWVKKGPKKIILAQIGYFYPDPPPFIAPLT